VVIGEQPVWDPRTWAAQSAEASGLRSQLSRARNKGVVIRELSTGELLSSRWRESLARLRQAWLDSRALAPMGFLVHVELFTAPVDRRTFVAERQGQLVACLAAVPVHARQGWLFEDILRLPTAPNGTTELLIDTAMRAAAAGGSTYVTLGLAPLSGPVPWWLRFLRRSLRELYDFQGVHDFRAKLRPARWDPIELAFIPKGPGRLARHVATLGAVVDVLTTFAHGDLVGFGLRTAFRHPRLVTGALAWGLVPWMAVLACVGWPALFPSPLARQVWLVFDALMGVALFALAWRFRPGLAKAVRAAALCDGALGAVQLGAMGLEGHPATSSLLAVLSLLTPLAAAALLSEILPSPCQLPQSAEHDEPLKSRLRWIP
jgi:phosphatidylglycerol lysyltransferase